MDKKKYMTEEEFNNTPIVKEIFGDYANYTSYSTPTKSDNVYDNYMKEALNLYNQGVQENKDMAKSQSANALAQYNEVNRNINELNKASGKANTGYAGDMSIDAYNAYRNSVNESYANAEKSNNDLYSYYLNGMMELQKAKDEHQYYEDERETKIVQELQYIVDNNGTYDDGYLTTEAKTKINDYLTQIYGDIENAPSGIKAYLGTLNGYNDTETDYETNHNYEYKIYNNTELEGGEEARTIDGSDDFFKISINGSKYRLTTVPQTDTEGKLIGDGSVTDANILRLMPKEAGSFMRYDGKYYVRDKKGKIYEARKNDGTVLKVVE